MLTVLARAVGILLLILIVILLALSYVPTSWVIARAESIAGDSLDADVHIEDIRFSVLSRTPGVTVSGIEVSRSEDGALIGLDTLNITVDVSRLLRAELVFDSVSLMDGHVSAVIDSTGSLNGLLPAKAENTDMSGADSARGMLPAVHELLLHDIGVQLDDRYRNNKLDLTVDGSASTTRERVPTTLTISGTVDDRDLTVRISSFPLVLLTDAVEHDTGRKAMNVEAEATLGLSRVSLEGEIHSLTSGNEMDLVVDLNAEGTDDFQVITETDLPVLPPFQLSGDILKEGDTWILRRFSGRLGDSDWQGDIRFNPAAIPPQLFANVISETLDLDDLAGLIGASPDPRETVADPQSTGTAKPSDSQGLLPDDTLIVKPVTENFDGAIEYQAMRVLSPVWPVESLDIRTEINGNVATATINELVVAGGLIDGTLTMDVSGLSSNAELSLQVKQIGLAKLLSSVGLDSDSVGKVGGQVQLWMSGNSIAELASSADGGAFFLMTGGKLDALLVELTGLDLTESLSLFVAPGSTSTAINCAFVDLQSRGGIIDIATLVLDTDDTILLADGSIDLASETLDITVEPHPKDASVLSAQTSVRVTGSFDDIGVVPGRSLASRAAAAAALAAIVSPAAAILPFIDTGTGEDSQYCSGMVSALDKAR